MRLMSMRAGRKFNRDERGAVLAELAIVLPIMLVMFAGVAEFGQYFYQYSTLAKATRLGARFLATAAADGSDDAAAKNLVVYGNTAGTGTPIIKDLATTNVTIVWAGGVNAVPATVSVSISGFKHQPLFDIGKLMKSSNFTMNVDIKPSTTMRYLLKQPAV
jgi:Flp pilus assembly protein TadG